MKPNDKSRLKTRTKELVSDLSAVRSAVLNNQPQAASAAEQTAFQARLFESWAIQKLAQNECQWLSLSDELEGLRKELDALRKSLPRPARKAGKQRGSDD
jgi:hypothetical protein